MICRIKLDIRTDLRAVSNMNGHHVQENRIKVDEHTVAKINVAAVIAVERGTDR